MSIPENVVLFHCALPILDEDGEMITKANGGIMKESATHTLAFSKVDDNTLVMGWAASRVKFDGYNKKTGREIALTRIDHLETRINDHPNRVVVAINELTPKYLPNKIIESNIDFYINSAITTLIDTDEFDEVNILFRSYRSEDPVCSITVDVVEVEDEDLMSEKVDVDATTDYIFACFVNDENEVIVYVQNRDTYASGYSDDVNDDMVAILGPVVNNGDFVVVDQHKPILCHEDKGELGVVRFLKANGLAYSVELEEEILSK